MKIAFMHSYAHAIFMYIDMFLCLCKQLSVCMQESTSREDITEMIMH